jgi:hypothetical protein
VSVVADFKKYIGVKKLRKLFDNFMIVLTGNEAPVPYSAIFVATPPFYFPSTFSTSDFPGLLLCHVVKGSDDRVVTYWLDESHFRAYGEAFTRAVGLSAAQYSGVAVEIKQPRHPWWMFWRRISAKELVLGVFAFVGAILGLRDYSAELLARPEVTMSFPAVAHIDTAAGSESTVPVTIRSEMQYSKLFVKSMSTHIQPESAGKMELLLDASRITNLAPGELKTFNLVIKAPPHSDPNMPPDVFTVAVDAYVKAGKLRFWNEPPKSGQQKLWVWAAVPTGPPPTISRAVGRLCELTGTVYVAKPYPKGLVGEAKLVDASGAALPEMSIHAARDDASKDQLFSNSGTQEVEFRTPPIEKFTSYPYTVSLISSQPLGSGQCENWSRSVTVTLHEPIGE